MLVKMPPPLLIPPNVRGGIPLAMQKAVLQHGTLRAHGLPVHLTKGVDEAQAMPSGVYLSQDLWWAMACCPHYLWLGLSHDVVQAHGHTLHPLTLCCRWLLKKYSCRLLTSIATIEEKMLPHLHHVGRHSWRGTRTTGILWGTCI